jgi:hypothetical protein
MKGAGLSGERTEVVLGAPQVISLEQGSQREGVCR